MQAFRRLSSLTSHLLPQEDTEFDYVIVGGGTVGCVLANRLTEDAGVSVAVIEGGPSDENCLLYTSPSPRDRQKSRMPSSA